MMTLADFLTVCEASGQYSRACELGWNIGERTFVRTRPILTAVVLLSCLNLQQWWDRVRIEASADELIVRQTKSWQCQHVT